MDLKFLNIAFEICRGSKLFCGTVIFATLEAEHRFDTLCELTTLVRVPNYSLGLGNTRCDLTTTRCDWTLELSHRHCVLRDSGATLRLRILHLSATCDLFEIFVRLQVE